MSPSLNVIIAQRLLRSICPHCKEKKERNSRDIEYLKTILEKLKKRGIVIKKDLKTTFVSKGCDQCNKTGYLGRIAVSETLFVSEKIKSLIQQGMLANDIEKQAYEEGFIALKEDAIIKVIK